MGIEISADGVSTFTHGITASEFTGDGSLLTGTGTSFNATASGSIATGETIVVNSDGTVSACSGSFQTADTGTESLTTNQQYQSRSVRAVYDENAQRVVVAHMGSGSVGYVQVGSISSGVVTFGTPVTFSSGGLRSNLDMIYDPDTQQVVIAFCDFNSSNKGYAVVGAVSGLSITFGTAVEWSNGVSVTETDGIKLCYDKSDDKVIIVWKQSSNSQYCMACAGTVGTTSISFTTPVSVEGLPVYNMSLSFDETANVTIMTFQDFATGGNTVKALSCSSGTITAGSNAYWNDATSTDGDDCEGATSVYDPDNGKVVCVSRNQNNNYAITAFDVSGTTVTAGAALVIPQIDGGSTTGENTIGLAYDTIANKFLILQPLYDTTGYNVREVTFDGSTFTLNAGSTTFTSGQLEQSTGTPHNLIHDPNEDELVAVLPMNNLDIDTRCLTLFSESTNLTLNNFVGFSNGTYSDGQTASVLSGGVFTTTGLTGGEIHYVDAAGAMSNTPYKLGNVAGAFVSSGLALSSTELLVKGN